MITLDKLNEEFQSEYLQKGFSQEKIELYNFNADLDLNIASANLEVKNPFISQYAESEGLSHLSDLTAYRALGQLIVGFNCMKLSKSKKELGELWQIAYFTNNKRTISLDNKIPLSAKCLGWLPFNKLIYQKWEFEISNRSFYGEVKCAISIPH